jgi:putative adhesin
LDKERPAMMTLTAIAKVSVRLAVVFCFASIATLGAAVEDTIKKDFQVKPGSKLVVAVDRGSIEVKPANGDHVEIEVKRKLDKVSESQAQEIFRDHEVTLSQEGDEVRVRAQFKLPRPSSKHQPLQVHYEILVPNKFNVDLRTAGGSVAVGDLEGEVRAQTSAGNIKVGRIDGPVKAETNGGRVSVAASSKSVMAKTSAGNIDIGETGGDVSADTNGGSVSVKKAKGKVIARTSAGNIDIGEAEGEISAKTNGGSVSVKRAAGKVLAKTSAGSIRIGEVDSDVTAETNGGSIKAGKVQGKLVAKTSAGNIDVAEVNGTIEASTNGGSITAGLKGQPKESSRLEASAGNIKLTLDENAAVELDARTSAGSVQCDLLVTVTQKEHRGELKGKINGGGPALILRTNGGNVHVRK